MKRGEVGSGRWAMAVMSIILVLTFAGVSSWELLGGIALGFLLTIGLTK